MQNKSLTRINKNIKSIIYWNRKKGKFCDFIWNDKFFINSTSWKSTTSIDFSAVNPSASQIDSSNQNPTAKKRQRLGSTISPIARMLQSLSRGDLCQNCSGAIATHMIVLFRPDIKQKLKAMLGFL